ncbi:MAG: hypothetical protein R2800_14150 [Flavipsychrobacter sp.]
MKKIIIVLIALLSTFSIKAQKKESRSSFLISPYVLADVGRSYNLVYQYYINDKFRAYLGVKYHQNFLTDAKLDSEELHHRFHANSEAQKIGLNAGVQYFIKWKYSIAKPYVYYDLSYSRMDTRAFVLSDNDTTINQNSKRQLLTPVKYYNVSAFENNIGLGLLANIAGGLSINLRGGVGANFIFNLPEIKYTSGMHINPSFQFAVGLQYAIPSK